MISAADDWLERWSNHRYPEISFAARLGWTPIAKRKLLENLSSWLPFWAAEALLDGWGMNDSEVAQALKGLVESDKAAQVGHLLPRVITNREECFERLIALFESDSCREPGRILAGLVEVMESGQSERVIEVALKWAEQQQIVGGRERVVYQLFEHFAEDSRVKRLAVREMARQDGAWIEALRRFGTQPEVFTKAVEMSAPLPTNLRSEIVNFLETNSLFDQQAFDLLAQYDLECDPILKTRCAIGYAKALIRKGNPRDKAIEDFSKALLSGGLHYEARRQTAVCGLDILGRLDLVTSLRADGNNSLPITVTGGLHANDAFVGYLLSHWSRLRTLMGEGFTATFFGGSEVDLYWWSHVAEIADNFADVRETLLGILGEITNEQLYSDLLIFLGRVRPKSNLLREHCLRVIKNQGRPTGRWIDTDTAAYLLGRDFGGDESVLAELLDGQHPDYTSQNVLWAVCEGWPEATVVKTALGQIKVSSNGVRVGSILDMQVICCQGTAKELVDSVIDFLLCLHSDMSYQSAAFLRPLVRRIKADVELQSLLKSLLVSSENADVALGVASILGRSIGCDTSIKVWCTERAFVPRNASAVFSPVAFDLTVGAVRTAWEVAMEIMSGGI